MSPYSHIYIATQVLNSSDWQAVLGAVTPDIGVVLSGTPGFEWKIGDGIETSLKVLKLSKQSYPELALFSHSYALHCAGLNGADYYSDGLHRDGYAYTMGKPLIPKISNLLEVGLEQATIFSHNFIELAHDYAIVKKFPYLKTLFSSSVDVKKIKRINSVLHKVTGYGETAYEKALITLLKTIPNTISDDVKTRLSFVTRVIEKVTRKTIEEEPALEIINEANNIVSVQGLGNVYNARDQLKVTFPETLRKYE